MKENTETHYNDGLIDVSYIDDFCFIVFVNIDGECKVISYDNNFFSPSDMLRAYRELWRESWNDDFEECFNGFKKWMLDNGCPEEDLVED